MCRGLLPTEHIPGLVLDCAALEHVAETYHILRHRDRVQQLDRRLQRARRCQCLASGGSCTVRFKGLHAAFEGCAGLCGGLERVGGFGRCRLVQPTQRRSQIRALAQELGVDGLLSAALRSSGLG